MKVCVLSKTDLGSALFLHSALSICSPSALSLCLEGAKICIRVMHAALHMNIWRIVCSRRTADLTHRVLYIHNFGKQVMLKPK